MNSTKSLNMEPSNNSKNKTPPSCPLDYQVGVLPEWLETVHKEVCPNGKTANDARCPLCHNGDGGSTTVSYYQKNIVRYCGKPEKGYDKENLLYRIESCTDLNNNNKQPLPIKEGTTSDIVKILQRNGCRSKLKRKRKLRMFKKGLSTVCWVVACPLMCCLLCISEPPDLDDEDDLVDDVLRPWSYRVDYVRPEDRL